MTTAGQHAPPPTNGAANGQPPSGAKTEEKRGIQPYDDFRSVLEKMKPEIKRALPSHLDIERMIRIVLTVFRQTPDLLLCTKESILARIMQCAQLGLEPDGLLGQAWLVPFKNRKNGTYECQLFIGYKGLLKLARNSGEVAGVSARVVFERDQFEFEYGLAERCVHVPFMLKKETDEPGEPIYVYAVIRMKDGTNSFEVMSSKEVERIRLLSPSRDSDAWEDHWQEMAKKTVLRKALKLSPLSVEDKMARAIALDERADAGLPQGVDGSEIIDIGDVTAPSPIVTPTGDVTSSMKQRKDIVRFAGEAKVSVADVTKWFGKEAVDDLTRQEADDAIGRLKTAIEKDRKGGGES